MKSSTAAAAGASAFASLALPRGAFAGNDDTIRVALVGAGGRGTGAAQQALSTNGAVKLVAIADAFQDHIDKKLPILQKAHGDRVAVDKDHQFTGFDAYKKVMAMPSARFTLKLLSPPASMSSWKNQSPPTLLVFAKFWKL